MRHYTAVHLFSGIGGAALGFQAASAGYKGTQGRIRTLVGIDSNPEACEDFERLTGSPAACLDLFSREDYVAFHGKEPSADWHEVQPAEIRAASGGECPDIVFLSPPCKGFSGLLPKKSANSEKYQALNRLTVRGLWYTLEAFADSLPGIIILENVPRITTRGAELLAQLKGMLEAYGYAHHSSTHDCGEVGGLGQRRKRYLLIARLPSKVPAFVYQPPKRPLKSIGDVIGPMPMPDAPELGPMHRLPRLKFKTWLRLALIPAGGDWRDLQKIAPEEYRLGWEPRGGGCYGVQEWEEPGATVTANPSVKGSNAASIGDPRIDSAPRPGAYRVIHFADTSPTVVGSGRVSRSNGAAVVADPRLDLRNPKQNTTFKVSDWGKETGTVTGATSPSNGCVSIADPRVGADVKGGTNRHHNQMRVTPFTAPAGTVTGAHHVGGGAPSVADPRPAAFGGSPGLYGVNDWDATAPTITATAKVSSSNCACAIADPRTPNAKHASAFKVSPMDGPAPTVIGATSPGGNAIAIADVRMGCKPHNATMMVQDWAVTSQTVHGSMNVHAGPAAVADIRLPDMDSQPNPPPLIIALDGTWHRPLTTLELARLQSFPLTFPDGAPLKLAGKSDTRWRERIGNAVPPDAAQGMAEVILMALLPSDLGEWTLGTTDIWVAPQVDDERQIEVSTP